MLGATILVFGSHQVVGDFSLLYWIGIQACMCNDVPCAQALQWLSLWATAPLRAWALWTQMTQSTSMPTFTLTVNTTGCLLARRKPFLPPWQHGRKCLSGRTANSINCNKKLSYWVCAIKILSVSNSGVTISNPCWNQLQDFFGFKVKLPVEVASCVYSCTGINPWNDSSVNSFYFTLMVKRNLYDDKMTRGACTEKWFCSAVCSCLDLQKWCRRDLHLSWEKQWTALNACPDNAAGNTWHCLWTWASSTVSSAQTNTFFLMTDCM